MYEKMNFVGVSRAFCHRRSLSELPDAETLAGRICLSPLWGSRRLLVAAPAIDGVSPMPVSGFFHRRDDFPQDAVPLRYWFWTIFLMSRCKAGYSMKGLQKLLGNRKLSDGLDDGT